MLEYFVLKINITIIHVFQSLIGRNLTITLINFLKREAKGIV